MADAGDQLTMSSFPAGQAPIWDSPAATAHLTRELHDGVAGELSTMLLDLERFRVDQAGRSSVLAEISRIQNQLRFVLLNVRQLLYERRGMARVERDFGGSVRRGLVRRFSERTGLRVRLSVARSWPADIPAETALNLHRILQEALNNVDRHSGATSVRIRFDLPVQGDSGVITVVDNGRGFATPASGGRPSFGLAGIHERALLLGATATIANRRRGGSILTVSVPRHGLGL
jgi:two-component system, NarL family, sensor kinase